MKETLEQLEQVAKIVCIHTLGPGNIREWLIRQMVARHVGIMKKEDLLTAEQLEQIVKEHGGAIRPRYTWESISRKAFLYKAIRLLEQRLEAQMPRFGRTNEKKPQAKDSEQ